MYHRKGSSPLAGLSVGHLLNITVNDFTYETIRALERQSAWIKDALRAFFYGHNVSAEG